MPRRFRCVFVNTLNGSGDLIGMGRDYLPAGIRLKIQVESKLEVRPLDALRSVRFSDSRGLESQFVILECGERHGCREHRVTNTLAKHGRPCCRWQRWNG